VITDVQTLLDRYWEWLRNKTTLRGIGDYVEITTPCLDRHNDYLQIYARSRNGELILSDDGYILEDLELSGCRIDTPKRKALLKMTLDGFGVKRNERELEVSVSQDNFALRKHNLLQAMLSVNDLFYMASPIVESLFYEDVVNWLDISEIRYAPKVKFTGRSGYDHLFDFIIPKSKAGPERILRAINRPGGDAAKAMVFSWIDTKEVRPPESCAYAILNDSEETVSVSVLDAFRNYDVRTVLWSGREEVLEELAA